METRKAVRTWVRAIVGTTLTFAVVAAVGWTAPADDRWICGAIQDGDEPWADHDDDPLDQIGWPVTEPAETHGGYGSETCNEAHAIEDPD